MRDCACEREARVSERSFCSLSLSHVFQIRVNPIQLREKLLTFTWALTHA